MAERKKPQTTPVKDNSAGNEPNRYVRAMTTPQFNSVVKVLLSCELDRARQFRTASWTALKRLQLKRDLSKARKKVPKGASDNYDAGTLVSWMNNIQANEKKAVQQLIVLDATAASRG